MIPEIAYNYTYGWYIPRGRDQNMEYLHPDRVWRPSMWNPNTNSYGYFSTREAAEAALGRSGHSGPATRYTVRLVRREVPTLVTFQYYEGQDKSDVWDQIKVNPNLWFVAEIYKTA